MLFFFFFLPVALRVNKSLIGYNLYSLGWNGPTRRPVCSVPKMSFWSVEMNAWAARTSKRWMFKWMSVTTFFLFRDKHTLNQHAVGSAQVCQDISWGIQTARWDDFSVHLCIPGSCTQEHNMYVIISFFRSAALEIASVHFAACFYF